MSGARPPGAARLPLQLILPSSVREFVLGDLEEEFGELARQQGGRVARRWYWRQALGSIVRSTTMKTWGEGAKRTGGSLSDSIWQDVGFAVRSFGRRPLFTATALGTLALGIGATTAVFGFADAVLFRPIPGVQDTDRLAIIWFGQPSPRGGIRVGRVSYPNLADLNAQLTGFERLAGYQRSAAHIATAEGGPERLSVQFVTPSYFSVLGVQPVLGRTFTSEEDDPVQGLPVAVISHRVWTRVFGAATDVLGRTVQVNARPFSIIGVLPEGFHGTERLVDSDVWLPGSTLPYVNHFSADYSYADRGVGAYYEFVARLAPGATWVRAEAELRTASARLAELYPGVNDNFTEIGPIVFRGIGVRPLGREGIASTLRLLFGVVGLILLIACANVVNLLLFRGLLRRGERAVRTALGATRRRLVRQQLTESILLWMGGGAIGLGVAWAMAQLLEGTMLGPASVQEVPIDWRVAGFALGASLVTGLVFGTLPAAFAPRVELVSSLKDAAATETGGHAYLRSGLTTLQIAATLPLLVGALLFVRTLHELNRVELGFGPEAVSTAIVAVEDQGYSDPEAAQYYRSFVQRLEGTPGVTAAAVSTGAPLSCCGRYTRVRSADGPDDVEPIESLTYETTAGFRRVLELPLLRGRWFTQQEVLPPGAQTDGVVVVSATLAEQLFGSDDPLGHYLEFPVMGREGHRVLIVGVVGDVRWNNLDGPVEPIVFEPLGQSGRVPGDPYLLVRSTTGEPVFSLMRRVARELDASLPITELSTLSDAVSEHLSSRRVFANLLTLLGVLAVTFASVGLYGIVALAVAARTREFAVRMAMGADAPSILSLVLQRGLVLIGLGIGLGLAGAYALSRIVESRLFGVAPLDPVSHVAATLSLCAVALVALLIPARRATRVDPVAALRSE